MPGGRQLSGFAEEGVKVEPSSLLMAREAQPPWSFTAPLLVTKGLRSPVPEPRTAELLTVAQVGGPPGTANVCSP
jgi:hypothetical protein